MNLKLLAFFRNYTQIGKGPTKITEVELNKGKWDNNSNLKRLGWISERVVFGRQK